MPGLEEAARLVQERSARQLPFDPGIEVLEETDPGSVAAVDGSHAVLVDNGAVWVVALRTHIHIHGGPAPLQVPPTIQAASAEEAPEAVASAYDEVGFQAPQVRSADAYAEALRALSEWRAWKEALAVLPKEGLLLVDGALEQLPGHAQAMADRLLENLRGRHVAGVAKRSGIHAQGVPVVPAVAAAGRSHHPEAAWSARIPKHSMAHICLLHPAARHAFRIDTPGPEVLGRLVPLARDAVYTGYPYPLAKVHNLATITHAEARRLRESLQRAVRQAGGATAAAILDDFHDILDRNVPR